MFTLLFLLISVKLVSSTMRESSLHTGAESESLKGSNGRGRKEEGREGQGGKHERDN